MMTWWYQKSGDASYRKAATLMEAGVRGAVEQGQATADQGGKASTSGFADAVIRTMQGAR
jgi:isocitrate/isopropylmalate dehydrogenase